MNTKELQNRLEKLVGERIPHRTLYDWKTKKLIKGPKLYSFGKGGGKGLYADWSEDELGDIAVRLAIRKIRRAKAFDYSIRKIRRAKAFDIRAHIKGRKFLSGVLLEAVSRVYNDWLPVRASANFKAYTPRVRKVLLQRMGADIHTVDIDSLGRKQVFYLPSPFIPLSEEPRVASDDNVHAAMIAEVVIGYEKKRCKWGDGPARVVFPWYLECPQLWKSPYVSDSDWHLPDRDHPLDYDMICLRDDVRVENSDEDALIICLNNRIVLEVRRGAVKAFLPWFMLRRGYRTGPAGRHHPGLPPFPSYFKSSPTRLNEHRMFRIRRRDVRLISDRVRLFRLYRYTRRPIEKSGYLRPWKRRRARSEIGRSGEVSVIPIDRIKPRY